VLLLIPYVVDRIGPMVQAQEPPGVVTAGAATDVSAIESSTPTEPDLDDGADADDPAAVESALEPNAEPAAPIPPAGPLPISRIAIPSIKLEAEVVVAPFVDRDGGTWDVPPYKAGHAQLTPGAGEVGNTVIFGHLTSLTLGNVFEHLDRTQAGDVVRLYTGDRSFDYRITQVRRVARDDVSVLNPTDKPAVTLITCAGIWLPFVHDYSERLVVRGDLVAAAGG
jgi:LPXTG-site transpeptidase (sortase) family protein